MTIAHRLEAQGIIAAAHRAGATLPADLLDRAARLDDLDRLATDRANVSHHVLDLAATLDADPDTFHAALDRAALDLAASEHRATLLATWAICTGCYAQWEQVTREADHPSALRVVRAVEAMAPERLR